MCKPPILTKIVWDKITVEKYEIIFEQEPSKVSQRTENELLF